MGSFLDFIEASIKDTNLFQRFIVEARTAANGSSIQKFLLSEGFSLSNYECEQLLKESQKSEDGKMYLRDY